MGKWRQRFLERRSMGSTTNVRPGKPRSIDDERVAELINKTLHTKPADGATHWSVRTVAAETGDLQDQRAPLLQALGPAAAPHRAASSSPPIRSSSRSCAMSWGCI